MKTETLINPEWNELVFENRSKDYGAFALRKSYSERLMEATLASVGIAILLFFIPSIVHWISGDTQSTRLTIVDGTTILPPPLIEKTIKIERTVQSTLRQIARYVAPVVTSEPVADEKVVTPDSDPVPEGDPNGSVQATGAETLVTHGEPDGSVVSAASSLPLDFAEVMPQYEGGFQALVKFIEKKLRYPNSARKTGAEGRVFIRFVINADGKVSDVEVLSGIQTDCDREAARVVALMKNWIPGKQNHKPVAVRMALPIKFRISE